MRRLLLTSSLIVLAVGGFTGCAASSSEPTSPTPYVAEDGTEQRVHEKEDVNSKLIRGENYVSTYTVKLNDGSTVECLKIDEDVECFPETLQER